MTITWKGSPNFDHNRKTIDRIVLHWMDGTIAGADARFQNPASKVSAHYGISDTTVYQWVKEEDVAYHAGDYPMNQRSLGIEHQADPSHPATEATMQSSIELVYTLCTRYKIPVDRQHIIKHSEVPHATECCGTLDIERIVLEVQKRMSAQDQGTTITISTQERDLLVSKASKFDTLCRYFGESEDQITSGSIDPQNMIDQVEVFKNAILEAQKKIDELTSQGSSSLPKTEASSTPSKSVGLSQSSEPNSTQTQGVPTQTSQEQGLVNQSKEDGFMGFLHLLYDFFIGSSI